MLVNTDPIEDVENLTLGAIIYDTASNPVAVSRTYINLIQKSGEQNVFLHGQVGLRNTHKGKCAAHPRTLLPSSARQRSLLRNRNYSRAIFAE